MANPYQFWNPQMARKAEAQREQWCYETPRKSSTTSTTSNSSGISTPSRLSSSANSIQTRSIPFCPGVAFERSPSASLRSDDDIIFIPVKTSDGFRRKATEGSDELPARPPKRSFLRRLGRKITGAAYDDSEFRIVRMPRREYRKYFARDCRGNYIGTEEEREWTEEDLMREFGEYRSTSLRDMHC